MSLSLKIAAAGTAAASTAAAAASKTWAVAFFGVPPEVLFAGFAGAAIALAILPPMKPAKAFGAVVVGTLCAAYLTLPIALNRGWSAEYHHGLAFLLGAGGHVLLTWLLNKGPEILTSRTQKGPTQ